MKARVDCPTCRNRIRKEIETEFLKHEYQFFENSARTMAIYAICGVLMTMINRKRSKAYIKQMYEDMCFFFSASNVFGKSITMTDIMNQLSTEYDINWDKLTINLEGEQRFLTRKQKGE